MIFSIFRSRGERELESIVESMKINLANNYKEPAHKDRERIKERAEGLYSERKIKESVYRKYMRIYEEYTIKLKDYKH
ncbi:MAG: hypothetical protein IJE84_04415 [Clostridia bacterium]|nr:hypothetical protein [Clostridia bacterium]